MIVSRASRSRWLYAVVIALLLPAFACQRTSQTSAPNRKPPPRPQASNSEQSPRVFSSNDPLRRGCGLKSGWLERIWRGYVPGRSEDISIVPSLPNFAGGFYSVNHSGPFEYLQQVPLVLYGPGRIRASGRVHRPVTIADVYPTVGRSLNVRLPSRDGSLLEEALVEGAGITPKLVVTVVWDGVGRNVLERWPEQWPTLRRLEREGTSYLNATVGSSPSITPTTHATLGTGAFPRKHKVAGIFLRKHDTVVEAFEETSPVDLRMSTYGDDIDAALGNRPKVGMLGWSNWHLGMMGHGAGTDGGDRDHAAIVLLDGNVGSNSLYYSTPSYLYGYPGFSEHAAASDREDGKEDGLWMGHEILTQTYAPAWVHYETDMAEELLRRERYGRDTVPDLFFINYKMTDYAGHEYFMDSPEMGSVVAAQDQALAELLRFLKREVRDYVLILTADHGHVPRPSRSSGWPVQQGPLEDDINAEFKVPEGESLVDEMTAVGIFVDHELMRSLGTTQVAISEYLNGYRIRANWEKPSLPARFEGRGNENMFAAAFPNSRLPGILRCKFGAQSPAE